MKRNLALLLALLMALSALAGCGAKNQTEASAENDGPSVSGSVIFDHDGLTVTTAGLDVEPMSEEEVPIIWVDVKNAGEKDVYLSVADGSVNGVVTEVLLIDYEEENGEYIGVSYLSGQTVPAGGSERYALSYYDANVPGIRLDRLGEIEFCFTTAEDEYSWYDYKSEPVVITVDKSVPNVDVADLGDPLWSNELFDLVIGEQDYDDWFGPTFYVYMKNKSDKFVSVAPDSAVVDGVACDYLLGGLAAAPGKVVAAMLSFDGEAQKLKGFEHMTLNLSYSEGADSESMDLDQRTAIEPLTVTYPPQIWGEYENGGLRFEVQPKYNDLITVLTPPDAEDGTLFSISETASMEADSYEGSGWLFNIAVADEETVHELLCSDMSGVEVFAKDSEGNYYLYQHPTDVRYARATAEEMERDQAQWTMLCEWAEQMKDKFVDQNGLEYAGFGNSELDMYVARAAWQDGVNYTVSTTEFGPVAGGGVDATRFAEFVLHGYFGDTDATEAPDGEYVALEFPDEDVRIDFFFAPDAYARVTSGGQETLYQAAMWDDNVSYAEAMQGWYYALAEQAGVKEADTTLDAYCGNWYEQTAGRGMVSIEKSVAPGKANISATWPDSAAVMNEWELLAVLEDDRLAYENGNWQVKEFDETGEGWTTDESYEETGYFYLNGSGALCWHDDRAEGGEDSVFDLAD